MCHGVVRAKEMVWLASRPDVANQLSQAGPSIQFGPSGYWIAALPEEERKSLLAEQPDLAHTLDAEHGDRINEIVFIGIQLDPERIKATLDQCLVTDEEWGYAADEFPYPLP